MTRSCRKARRRPIPFDCAFHSGHHGPCSPYTLPPGPPSETPRTANTPVQSTANDDTTGTLDIDWPDGTRATWFLTAEHLDTLAALIEHDIKPADSIKC